MTENQLLARVVDLAGKLGLLVYHVHDSRRIDLQVSDPGFPDLVVAGQRGVIFAELKSANGETTAAQDQWAWILSRAGATYRLWRPPDLEDGTIGEELQALA